jgi:hypothetical protein
MIAWSHLHKPPSAACLADRAQQARLQAIIPLNIDPALLPYQYRQALFSMAVAEYRDCR